jgi:TadE-like protein
MRERRGMGAPRAPIATRGVAPRGQAATETMIMMLFLLLMIFGLVHLCMLMSVKFMVNNAAFSAARTAMIAPNDASTAAEEGLGWMRGWWRGPYSGLNTPYVQGPVNKTIRGKNRNGYRATYAVPFGLPIFNTTQPCGFTNSQNCGVRLIGFSPYARQPNITRRGDND